MILGVNVLYVQFLALVVTHDLGLRGYLDKSPFDIELKKGNMSICMEDPAVSTQVAHSLKPQVICGIVLCDKTAHFSMAFYCGQSETHLCNDHVV